MDYDNTFSKNNNHQANILDINNLSVSLKHAHEHIPILQNIQFSIAQGKTLCIVGESGCGKSMTALAILRLLPEIASIMSGAITFNNQDLTEISETQLQQIRGKNISIIFQEPMTSLNPVLSIGNQIAEPLIQHLNISKSDAINYAIELLNLTGISSPEKRIFEYPHQLSGGLRQRVMIAMALSCNPELLLADEPTTALDVTIQQQILTLLQKFTKEKGMSMLFITHNLGVVAEVADDVCVMYAGEIIEKAPVVELFKTPKHPYTQALINAVPSLKNKKQKHLQSIHGSVPTPQNLPKGCSFSPRCPLFHKECLQKPPYITMNKHLVACWLYHNK